MQRSTVDFTVVLLIVSCFETIVAFRDELPINTIAENRLDLLGATYDSIARAIRAGRGFSDPHGVPSGPTAWVPPALPAIICGFYGLFDDDRRSVVRLVILLQAASVATTGLVVTSAARRLGQSYVGHAAFVVGCVINFFWFFQHTHDVWLLLFAFNLLWIGVERRWAEPRNLTVAIAWGIIGGFLALCSPTAGFAWGIVTIVACLSAGATQYRRCSLALVVALLIASPWVVRNYFTFQRFVPIKSNLAFELWQAQCLDNDGVIDDRAFSRHPWSDDGKDAKNELLKVGEARFLEVRWNAFRQSLADDPQRFSEHIVNRFCACFFTYSSTYASHESLLITRLIRAFWCIPTVFGFLILTFNRRSGRDALLCVTLYVVALSPYILISYYPRYAAQLGGIQMLLVVYGAAVLQNTLPRSRAMRRFRRQVAVTFWRVMMPARDDDVIAECRFLVARKGQCG